MQEILGNAGFITGLFYIIIILSSKGNHQSKWWLCLFIVLLNFTLLPSLLIELRLPPPRWINASFALLWGPTLYFYINSLLKEKNNNKWFILHALPFLVYYVLSMLFHKNIIPGPPDTEMLPPHLVANNKSSLFFLIQSISLLGYAFYSLLVLNNHSRNIQNYYSYNDVYLTIRWSYVIILSFVLSYLIVVITEQLVGKYTHFILGNIQLVLVTLFLYTIGYLGIKQQPVFLTMTDNNASVNEKNKSISFPPKYARNKLDQELKLQYKDKLLQYMSSEKAYLQPKLSIEDLANALDIPKHFFSQIINDTLQQTFYSFVNAYRVNEVKQRIKADKEERFTLLAIAFDSGFNSKSGFNQNFKLETGQTPLAFKNSLKHS
jgi:AraC-like DNA-binding protein